MKAGKERTKITGRAAGRCPKAGFVSLELRSGKKLVMPTTCKQWRCRSCRSKLKALFEMRVSFGGLTLKHLYFITVTLRLDKTGPVNADFVRKVWRRWWSKLRRNYPTLMAEVAYVRVIELTKKGQPHVHLMMSFGREYEAECNNGNPLTVSRAWMEGPCKAEPYCLRHVLGKEWLWATGESFQVDVTEIKGTETAGRYMGKYLDKDFYGDALLDSGFRMRYNFSRKWPRLEQLHLLGTDEMAWVKIETVLEANLSTNKIEMLTARAEEDQEHALLEVVGEDYAVRLADRRERKRRVIFAERMLNAD